MVNVVDILKDLQVRAEQAADEFDADSAVESAKDAARKVKERLETDETARNLTIGGGVLLAGLLTNRGGRRLLGTVAKTGAVAALGALAYRAWQNRGQTGDQSEGSDAPATLLPGYVSDDGQDEAFSEALIHAMAAAAYADGTIDPDERANIDGILPGEDETIAHLIDGSHTVDESLDLIAAAAITPNHAAQLYAAAAIASCKESPAESEFLSRLADRLGLAEAHAASIANEARS